MLVLVLWHSELSYNKQSWHLYLAVKILEFQFLCFQFGCVLTHLERQGKMVQILGLLPPRLETRMEFLAPSFSLGQIWLFWLFGM